MNTHELDQLFGLRSPEAQLEADTSALMFSFLSIVDREMEARGMTKRALAAAIGTSAAYITQLFRGHKTINLETLAKIQSAMGIQFVISLDGVALDASPANFLEEAEEERSKEDVNYPWQGHHADNIFSIVA
jgi:transcriptional regulator with XRE-family HTH domain